MAKTDNLGPSLIVVAVIITSAVYGWSWWYILPLIAAYWYSQSIEETYKGARDLAKGEQRLKNEHLRLQNEKLEVDIEIAKLRKDATRERLHKGDYEKKVRYIRRILESGRPLDSQEIAVLNNEVVPYLKTLRPLEGVP